jgi:hypothetical protein
MAAEYGATIWVRTRRLDVFIVVVQKKNDVFACTIFLGGAAGLDEIKGQSYWPSSQSDLGLCAGPLVPAEAPHY